MQKINFIILYMKPFYYAWSWWAKPVTQHIILFTNVVFELFDIDIILYVIFNGWKKDIVLLDEHNGVYFVIKVCKNAEVKCFLFQS